MKLNLGIGSLKDTPYLYGTYQCLVCKQHNLLFPGSQIAANQGPCNCHKKTKFGAMRVAVNGIKLDSLFEARRFSKLAWLEAKKVISSLEVHPKFPMVINKKKICNYIADFKFIYRDETYVEDCKGKETALFRLKKKLLEGLYPEIDLILVRQ